MEGRKRKRQAKNGAADPSTPSPAPLASSSTRHPPPPPPPPQSLVDLLQSDAAVLRYFASLQSNLEADVGAWRDKAQKYKREAVALRRRLEQAENERRQRRKREKRDGSDSSDSDHGSDASSDAARKKKSAGSHPPKKTQPKSKERAKTNGSKSSSKSTSRKKNDIDQATSFEDDQPKRISEADRDAILSRLDEAYRCLDLLGVSLVDESYTPAPSSAPNADHPCDKNVSDAIDGGERQDEESTAEKTDPAAPSFVLSRRSDHDVAADLMRSLRSLVRVSTRISAAADSSDDGGNRDLARKYEPFPSRETDGGGGKNDSSDNDVHIEISACLPCCHEMLADQHPAAGGLGLAIRALTILDTFCGTILGDCSWDELFEANDNEADAIADVDNDGTTDKQSARKDMKLEHIRQGMRGRKDLVHSVVLSLQGEIMTRWAVEDRLARSDVGALLFDDVDVNPSEDGGDNDNDNDDNDNGRAKASQQSFDSRSFNRLALIVDRVMYARILSTIYHKRCHYDLVEKVVLGYIMSAMPSLEAEDYPQDSPALSFCVLEALMVSNDGTGNSWFHLSGGCASLSKVLQLCIQSTMKIWSARAKSTDGRIRDISRVELAALNRILQNKSISLFVPGQIVSPKEKEAARQARDILSEIVEQFDSTDDPPDESSALPLFLSLVLIGDFGLVAETSSKVKFKLDGANEDGRFVFSCMLLACCRAFQAIHYRNSRADSYSTANDISANLDSLLENLDASERSNNEGSSMYLPILAQCFAVLADGLGIHKAASHTTMETSGSAHVTKMIDSSSSIPTIRVINLERRSDRWDAIVRQARASHLLVVRGPASLVTSSESDNEAYFWGNYAFDGRGDVDFTNTRITLGDASIPLNDYVATHWLPSELSAFDKNAKEEEVSVPASTTERACALSHIASWKGVERSLRYIDPTISQQGNAFQVNAVAKTSSGRLLRISGFASGPALLHENMTMGPAPVCVIMEDDAVLVDRFRDRLATLLCELPRDFHFCSLGYGRPKNAPMIEFTEAVGIPTFLWYMTGYVLSMEGARLLLDSLPVVGPVDSWIGLKISSNWENEYGYAVGVGRDARKSAKKATMGAMQNDTGVTNNVLARKDLARLMKFRAFAAVVPLCSQKIGQGHVAGGADSSGRAGASSGMNSNARNQQRIIAKWRDRDSDIVYSGVHGGRGGKKIGVPIPRG